MSIVMPLFDEAVLKRRGEIVAALKRIVPGEGVIASEEAMRPYESDGLTAYRQLPMVVVLPETTAQVAAVLAYCHGEGIKVVPRGAGTSLSGGALPLGDGVLLGLAKFNHIREIDYDNRVAVVALGYRRAAVAHALDGFGYLSRQREGRDVLGVQWCSSIFPGLQGGPLMHVIAAKAAAFGEALQPSFRLYAKNVVENAKALAESMKSSGFDIVSGGTDTHLMLVDLRPKRLTGKVAEAALVTI